MLTKNQTYRQHDNEKISFYRSSVDDLNSKDQLNADIDIDVCVIGGGLTGISSALNLSKKGYTVAICEARKVGWGASGRNGGQLGIGMRKDQYTVEKMLGINHAKELWNLGLESVDEVKSLIKENNIDCHLVNGVMSTACFEKDIDEYKFEIEHMSKNYQFEGYKYFNKSEIKHEIDSDIYQAGMLNSGSYHLNPLKLTISLANLIKKNVKIYENNRVLKLYEKNDKVEIVTKNGIIKANKVVVACNGYLDTLLGSKKNKFIPINNYIVATEPLGEKKAREIIRNNYAVCDTRFIIDYYRFSEDWRMIFGGGETFTSKFVKDSKSFVTKRMLKVFPQLKDYKIDYSWGGTLAITVNRLPHFGSIMNNKVIYAFGYSGHGLALSVLAGKLIAEHINGNSDRFKFFSDISHMSIPCGSLLRRPIYSSTIMYYKFRDYLSS
ncbi:FAD-binding oxidoreductase [Pelagibacterales bacterium SAG-MED31]|nr:FAD-binding oxidoreductase [Pelagibacterales bacterium SAG-MED31]